MKTKVITFLALLLSLVTFSQTTFTVNNLNYETIDANSVRLTSGVSASGHLEIPDTVTDANGIVYSVTEIGDAAFSNYVGEERTAFRVNKLTSITIPSSVTLIGDFAFAGNSLITVSLPEKVTSIGSNAFGENNLESVIIPNSVTSIGIAAFVDNNLESVIIPNSITSIAMNVFRNNNLLSVTIPNSVISIGNGAFDGNNLESVNIPNSVTSIGIAAFFNNQLTSLTIPNSVTSIERGAFFGNQLTTIIALGDTPAIIHNETFDARNNIDLIVPTGAENDYKAKGWTGFKSITEIGAKVELAIKVFIQGASLNPNTDEENLMRDDLRVIGLLPTTSPYADAVTAPATVFEVAGENAIVDWVLVELRNSLDSSQVITSTSALVQRDGDVVALDGISPIEIAAEIAAYFIVIQHRNHLGIITANPVSLSPVVTELDFTTDTTLTKGGVNALKEVSAGVYALFSGDFNDDKVINFNDRTAVLFLIGGSISTYTKADMDMNAQINFTDVNGIILFNIGRFEQFTTSE